MSRADKFRGDLASLSRGCVSLFINIDTKQDGGRAPEKKMERGIREDKEDKGDKGGGHRGQCSKGG